MGYESEISQDFFIFLSEIFLSEIFLLKYYKL
jgi:hypothetical protein